MFCSKRPLSPSIVANEIQHKAKGPTTKGMRLEIVVSLVFEFESNRTLVDFDLPVEAIRKFGQDDRCDRSGHVWGRTHQLCLPAGETHRSSESGKVELGPCAIVSIRFEFAAIIHRLVSSLRRAFSLP